MESNKGFFWHVHHDRLISWCWSYDERADYIRTEKPLSQHGLRLRLFQPVQSQLPEEVVQAGERFAFTKAQRALIAMIEIPPGIKEVESIYMERLDDLRRAFWIHAEAISELHAKECPDCPWDGETIFPF